MAHLGPRPTFEGAKPTIEVHIFDFAGDLYGARLRLDFVQRIRDIETFDSTKALAAAMRADAQIARRLLSP